MFEVKDLTVSVTDKDILKDFNLKINEGEIHAIMGPNGVGKSTICRIIMGDDSYQIKKGEIKYKEEKLNNLTPTNRAKLGIYLLNQNPITIEGVTNAEMLRMALSEKTGEHIKIFDFNKKMESICEQLELSKTFIHKNINEGASGGERKKIELLHLWMLEPNFIILDEIDSGLDVDAIKIVEKSLNTYYKKFKPSILIITHHSKILNSIKPNYVHILKDGHIVKSGDKSLADKIEKTGFSDDREMNDLNE